MTMWGEVLRTGIQIVTEQAVTMLRSRPKLPETPPRPPKTETCKACTVHLQVGMAYLLVKQIADGSRDDQMINPTPGSPIDLARQHIGEAINQIPDIATANPETAEIAIDLAGQLPDIERRLLAVRTTTEVKVLRDDLSRVLDTAYRVPTALSRPPEERVLVPKTELEELQGGISALRQQIAKLEKEHGGK